MLDKNRQGLWPVGPSLQRFREQRKFSESELAECDHQAGLQRD